jgi:hypothetical protein
MKTLSRPVTIIILVAVALVIALTLRAYATKPAWNDAGYMMKIKKARKYKDANMDDTKFKKLLEDNEAIYYIRVKKEDGTESDLPGSDCPALTAMSGVDNATRELVLICGGARVTQRAGFNTAAQMNAVESALAQ